LRTSHDENRPIERRVGVFGPYEDEGEDILHQVAQKISEKGYAPIMGFGYYQPNKPDELCEIAELLPPMVRDILGLDAMQNYFLANILPSLVSMGTFNMMPIKAQYVELLGCFRKRLPILGYVITEEISRGKEDCPHLKLKSANASRCVAPDTKSCPSEAARIPFCPFLRPVRVPWTYRIMFLNRPKNELVALKSVNDLFLDDFLKS